MSRHIATKYQIFFTTIMLFVPVLIGFNIYAGQVQKQDKARMATQLSASLDVYITEIRDDFKEADKFLYMDCWSNDDIAIGEIRQNIAEFSQNSRNYKGAMYIPKNSREAVIAYSNYTDGKRPHMVDAVNKIAKASNVNSLGWVHESIQDTTIFLRIAEYESYYVACFFDIANLGRNATSEYGMSSAVAFISDGKLLNDAYWLKNADLTAMHEQNEYYTLARGKENYLVARKSFLGTTALYSMNYKEADWIYVSTIVYIFVIAVTFIINIIFMRQSVLKPLAKLEEVMQKIRDGHFEERSNDFSSVEFAHINETFNQMINSINTLKIEQYEHELYSQKLETDALRLQIRPHFYLNCLKNLYSLSQLGENDALQKSILFLSEQLRYTFDLKNNNVKLSQELDMCENYCKLQGIGQLKQPKIEMSVDAQLMNIDVPPISLLTFVENCFKHAVTNEAPLMINISARRYASENGSFISITVSDNGKGFAQDVLEKLNYKLEEYFQNSCVGIKNVVRRFELLYSDRFSIAFYNKSGAVIEILIQTSEVKTET